MEIRLQTYREVTEELLDCLAELEVQIFEEPYSREKLEQELKTKNRLLAIVAVQGDQLVGFKVGYEMTATLFYSWIGGVIPQARGRGIARRLMDKQHVMAKDQKFEYLRTETENRFKPMLILNLRHGFEIVGTRTSKSYPRTIIILEKKL